MRAWRPHLYLLALFTTACVLPVHGATADELNLQAIQQMRLGHYESAEVLWRQVIDTPESTAAQKQGAKINLSVLYHKMGKESEANTIETELGLKKTNIVIENKQSDGQAKKNSELKKPFKVIPNFASHPGSTMVEEAPTLPQKIAEHREVDSLTQGISGNGLVPTGFDSEPKTKAGNSSGGIWTSGPSSRTSGGGKDVDFGPYLAALQRKIKRGWFPPRGQESRRVQVIFKVHHGGELSNLRIETSAGVDTADQAALQATRNAFPFDPLPLGAPEAVDIQFTFDYNVFNGGFRGF